MRVHSGRPENNVFECRFADGRIVEKQPTLNPSSSNAPDRRKECADPCPSCPAVHFIAVLAVYRLPFAVVERGSSSSFPTGSVQLTVQANGGGGAYERSLGAWYFRILARFPEEGLGPGIPQPEIGRTGIAATAKSKR
jgi:hypothetical protein